MNSTEPNTAKDDGRRRLPSSQRDLAHGGKALCRRRAGLAAPASRITRKPRLCDDHPIRPGGRENDCHELSRISPEDSQLEPKASRRTWPGCVCCCSIEPNLVGLSDLERLKQAWKETGLKLQAATDQHAAMTRNWRSWPPLTPKSTGRDRCGCESGPSRSKVRSLQMYVGQPALTFKLTLAGRGGMPEFAKLRPLRPVRVDSGLPAD